MKSINFHNIPSRSKLAAHLVIFFPAACATRVLFNVPRVPAAVITDAALRQQRGREEKQLGPPSAPYRAAITQPVPAPPSYRY